jgi:hypothetical protein
MIRQALKFAMTCSTVSATSWSVTRQAACTVTACLAWISDPISGSRQPQKVPEWVLTGGPLDPQG